MMNITRFTIIVIWSIDCRLPVSAVCNGYIEVVMGLSLAVTSWLLSKYSLVDVQKKKCMHVGYCRLLAVSWFWQMMFRLPIALITSLWLVLTIPFIHQPTSSIGWRKSFWAEVPLPDWVKAFCQLVFFWNLADSNSSPRRAVYRSSILLVTLRGKSHIVRAFADCIQPSFFVVMLMTERCSLLFFIAAAEQWVYTLISFFTSAHSGGSVDVTYDFELIAALFE